MKAMVLSSPGELRIEEVVSPHLDKHDVLVRATYTGICGTDLKIYDGTIPVTHPLIMGHEIVGVIAENERGAMQPGERVVVDPVLHCGSCYHCRIGQTHLCSQGFLLGRDRNGGFAEYVSVPEKNVFRLPDSIDDQSAGLIQVLTTCVHAHNLTDLFPGESVVVLGLGVAGQLHAQLAKSRGASPVIGITRSDDKARLAKRLGADLTYLPRDNAIKLVRDATNGRGADLVIECTGMLQSIANAISLVRAGGRLLLFGITTVGEGKLPFYQLYYKEITIVNSRAATPIDFNAAINLVEGGAIQLKPLISRVMHFTELKSALGILESESDLRLKILLKHP